MDQITLERDGKGPLQFEGFLLSEVSTHTPTKARWTDLRLWAVENSDVAGWVVETVGVSIVEGETTRRDAIPCNTPQEVGLALTKNGKISVPGTRLLADACDGDEEIEDFYRSSVRKVERL